MARRTEILRRLRASSTVRDIGFVTLAGILGATVAFWTLELWRSHPRVPFLSGGDADLAMASLKTLDHHAWYYTTNRLGAPFGQNLRDFPAAADTINIVLSKAIGFATDSPALIVNMFFFLSYPLIAITGYLGCRLTGLRRWTSLMVGVIFTSIPFHRFRFGHLFLANYAIVPLVAALVIRQAGPRPLLRRRAVEGWRGYLHRDFVVGFAIVVAASASGLYYAVFTCLFLVISALIALLRKRPRIALNGLAAVAVIAFLVVVQLAPTILHQRNAGDNPIATRSLDDLDNYPLRPSVLLLPIVGHQVAAVREWRDGLDAPLIASEGQGEAIGAFGAAGFVLCLGITASRFASRRRFRGSARIADAPLFLLGGVLVASYSGLAVVLGAFGFTQIRAWNRISVFLAFFCIITAATLLTSALRPRRRLSMVLLPVVTLAAVWDQTTIYSVPNYDVAATHWSSEAAFYRSVESALDTSAAVFQLPLVDFPESPPVYQLGDYAQLAGYLHTNDLRWSYGGVKGRSADWRLRLDPTLGSFVDDLLIAGFTGLTVNLNGYADNGAAIDSLLKDAGLKASFDSSIGDVRFYDLRPALADLGERISAAAQAHRRTEMFDQPEVRFATGFYGAENPGGKPFRWVQPRSTITIQGPVPDVGPTHIRLELRTFAPGPWTLVVTIDGKDQAFVVTDGPTNVDVAVNLTGDPVVMKLVTDAPVDDIGDPRDLTMRLEGLPTVLYPPVDGN